MKRKKFLSVVAILAMVFGFVSQPLSVNAANETTPKVTMTDCGHYDVEWGGDEAVFSAGWQYEGMDMDKVTSIKVGAKDAQGRTVLEYTADQKQVQWQQKNGYVTDKGLSSAPFYKEYNGTPIQEGRDEDWTVTKGKGFDIWQPTLFYVEVICDGQTYKDSMKYNYVYPDVKMTDCGHFDVEWGGDEAVFSAGWQYEGMDMDKVTSIKVGAKDAQGRTVLEYTADQKQVQWQQKNGYVTDKGLSSAPFYKEYNGTPIQEGRDEDWTVTKGKGFDIWQPTLFYVEVEYDGETYKDSMKYNYNYPHIHEAVKVEAKEATYETEGNIEYWYCKGCDKYFADKALTKEMTKADTIIPKLEKPTEPDIPMIPLEPAKPVVPLTPLEPAKPVENTKPNEKEEPVKTDDESMTGVYVALGGMAMCAAGIIIAQKKKEEFMKK